MSPFCQAIVDGTEIFESLGFTAGSGSSLGAPCLTFDFIVDDSAEIMGTQVSNLLRWSQHFNLVQPRKKYLIVQTTYFLLPHFGSNPEWPGC